MTQASSASPSTFKRSRHVLIVFSKEMVDHLRDWRSLLLALIYPILGPLLIGILLALSSGVTSSVPQEPAIQLTVSGAVNDQGLVDFLEAQGVRLTHAPDRTVEQLEAEVRSRRLPLVLVIPDAPTSSTTFTVRILMDGGRVSIRLAAAALSELVHDYGRETSRDAIERAGLDPSILQPFTVSKVDLGTPTRSASILYGIMGPLTVFIIFLGSVYVSIDSIAGERERGSLEPLLTTPVERWVLLLGKSACALTFTALSTAVSLAAFKITAELAVSAIDPPPPATLDFLALFALALPLMALAVMLQILIAVLSRSMKEAQIYLGLLPLVPAMPGIALVFIPVDLGVMSGFVPILGHLILFSDILAGQPAMPQMVGLTTIATILPALLLFALANRLFQREAAFHSS